MGFNKDLWGSTWHYGVQQRLIGFNLALWGSTKNDGVQPGAIGLDGLGDPRLGQSPDDWLPMECILLNIAGIKKKLNYNKTWA